MIQVRSEDCMQATVAPESGGNEIISNTHILIAEIPEPSSLPLKRLQGTFLNRNLIFLQFVLDMITLPPDNRGPCSLLSGPFFSPSSSSLSLQVLEGP